MSLHLKELELEGFRSFKQRACVQFPNEGMILINGQHLGKEISSGSGKSSIAMAIAHALGFAGLPTTELKNRSSKTLYVRLTVSDGTHDYTIVRSPKLTLITPSATYEGKVAESHLESLICTNRNLAKSLTYRPQREQGRFVNATDAQNKEFLSTLLGLSAIEEGYEVFRTQLQHSTAQHSTLQAEIQQLQSFSTSDSTLDKRIEEVSAEYVSAQRQLASLAAPDTTAQLQSQQAQLRTALEQTTKAQREADIATNQNQHLKIQIINLQREIETLKNQQCPTCHRTWQEGVTTLEQKAMALNEALQKMSANVTLIKNAKVIVDSASALQAQLMDITQQLHSLQLPLQNQTKTVDTLATLLGSLQQQAAQQQRIRTSLKQKTCTIQTLQTEIDSLTHLTKILGRDGFLGVIFDEILADIETRTNAMLSYLPNIETFTISIRSENTLKTGATKKNITVRLYQDGNEINPKTLSGGQMCALELCTDIAVSEAIRARSGSPLGWIVLDEAMDGLDLESKRAALLAIKQFVRGQILVIDHSTEIKEAFVSTIQVQFDGNESVIVV